MSLRQYSRLRFLGLIATSVFIPLVLLSACWGSNRITATPTPVATVQPVVAVPPTAPTPFNAPGVVEHQPLTLWIPAGFAAGIEPTTDPDIAAAIREFSTQSPDAPLEIVLKAEEGEASLLSY